MVRPRRKQEPQLKETRMITNRIPFGLMPVLDATRELPRTVLPLKSVRYHFVTRSGLAEVELTQVYLQENSQPRDCEYLFPLPADAAVYRCEATVNGRVIRARIEEKEAARKLAQEKKAEGHRTALMESERDNLFTLSLGNIQPHDLVEVTLAYLQPLRRQSNQVSLDLPLCPGVRYIPGRTLLRSNRGSGIVDDTDEVPDASRITPPRIDGEHPDAAFVELEGEVDAAFLDGQVTSPSHQLSVSGRDGSIQVTLANGGDVPDRDLALRWQERLPVQTGLRGWVSQQGGRQYALVELRAPATVENDDVVPQDVYFLVDRSGSMQGSKWRKAIDALHGCVGVLNHADRVWVTFFESWCEDFGSEPEPPGALLADKRFQSLVSLGTGGGTLMAPALQHVLNKVSHFSPNRPAVLVLITDAQIGNDQEIVALMRQHPELPIHCFGIDTTLNDSLLLDLVRQQGGTFHTIEPREDVAQRLTQLGLTLRQAALTKLQVPDDWELAAGALPNLYAGQVQMVSIRTNGAIPGSPRLLARDQRNERIELQFHLTPVNESAPWRRWCKERLINLAARNDKAAAITLSREANLLCPFTAFVAWDDAEKVAIADHRLVQPAMAPEYFFGTMAAAAENHGEAVLHSHSERLCSIQHLDELKVMDFRKPSVSLTGFMDSARRNLLNRLSLDIANLPRRRKFEALIRSLQEWLNHHNDTQEHDVLDRLLADCQLRLETFRLALMGLTILLQLISEIQIAQKLKDLVRCCADRPSFYDEFRAAVSQLGGTTTRQELEDRATLMDTLETEALTALEEFNRRECNMIAQP
jgi:Ca-activated chloride channel family protein